MIFPSCEGLKADLRDHTTRTTNGVESFHRDLYRIVQKKRSIVPTLYQICAYLENEERNFAIAAKGLPIDYAKKNLR